MKPEIRVLSEKKLVGRRMNMSFSDNKTGLLWKGFMSGRKEIHSIKSTELYSMQIYDPLFFDDFRSAAKFEKWAAIEVTDFNSVPDGMETFILQGGLYAVFLYHGSSVNADKTFKYIYNTWLPDSDYSLDNRPHFEVLGEKYVNESPDSEEEIWIPVRPKAVHGSITNG